MCPGGYRVGGERITDQQRVSRCEMQDGAARGVSRRQDHLGRARYVERGTVTEGRDLADVPGTETAANEREPEEAGDRADLRRSQPLRRVLHLAASQRRVGVVHRDGNVAFGA